MRKNFTLRLSPNLYKELSSLAEDNQRSMAGQLRWLIINAASEEGVSEKHQEPHVLAQKKQRDLT